MINKYKKEIDIAMCFISIKTFADRLIVTYLKGAIAKKVRSRKVMFMQNMTRVAVSCDLSTMSEIL